jgi:hypothetical protein
MMGRRFCAIGVTFRRGWRRRTENGCRLSALSYQENLLPPRAQRNAEEDPGVAGLNVGAGFSSRTFIFKTLYETHD